MSVTKKKQHATTCFTWVGTKERKVKKKDLVYFFRGVVDSRKTEMMQIQLKQWAPSRWIFLLCPSCFMEFISGQQQSVAAT